MPNRKIAILTDSSAYLPDDLVEEYDIHVIPLTLNWGDTSYLDNVDITPEEFYTRLGKENELPTTSQPSAGEFKEFFEKLSKDYEGVVAVLLSAQLSGTVASAIAAEKMIEDFPIRVVDTQVTVMALGLCAVEAAKAADAGKDIDEIAAIAQEVGEKQRVMFVVDTLEFLHKGGRIGSAQRFVGSVLAIKPLLEITGGKIQPLESVRTKKKAISTMLSILEEDVKGKGDVHVTVFHGMADSEAIDVVEKIKDLVSPKSMIVGKLSPAIGVHTGPGTIGISYYAI